MKIALIADIHGNDHALRAVLEDIEQHGGMDEYWILGDLVAIGPSPLEVLEMLEVLPKTRMIRGNTDRYTWSRERPSPTMTEVQSDPTLLPTLIEVEADFSWTQGALTATGWLDWLANLPLELRTTLPDGTAALGVHASPGEDDGPGIKTTMAVQEIEARLTGCTAGLICVGHTHNPFDLHIGRTRIINPGSVSNHVGPEKRACYAIITAEESGYSVEHFRVPYDRSAVIQKLKAQNHPGADFIISLLA